MPKLEIRIKIDRIRIRNRDNGALDPNPTNGFVGSGSVIFKMFTTGADIAFSNRGLQSRLHGGQSFKGGSIIEFLGYNFSSFFF